MYDFKQQQQKLEGTMLCCPLCDVM